MHINFSIYNFEAIIIIIMQKCQIFDLNIIINEAALLPDPIYF